MNEIFRTYASWIVLETGLIILVLGLILAKRIAVDREQILTELRENIKNKTIEEIESNYLKGYLPNIRYTFIIVLIIFIFIICSIFTYILFDLFPTIPDAPNVVTTFTGVFGVIAGSIGLYKIFDANDESKGSSMYNQVLLERLNQIRNDYEYPRLPKEAKKKGWWQFWR